MFLALNGSTEGFLALFLAVLLGGAWRGSRFLVACARLNGVSQAIGYPHAFGFAVEMRIERLAHFGVSELDGVYVSHRGVFLVWRRDDSSVSKARPGAPSLRYSHASMMAPLSLVSLSRTGMGRLWAR